MIETLHFDTLLKDQRKERKKQNLANGILYEETTTPLRIKQDAEKLIPGIEVLFNSAVKLLKDNGINFKTSSHRCLPALVLAETSALQPLVKHVSEHSEAPHNDKRAYGHFEPYDYAIYLSIDEMNELLSANDAESQETAFRVMLEELIHAYTTNPSYSNKYISVGFSKYPKSSNKPLPQGVYYWNRTLCTQSEQTDGYASLTSFKENPEDIILTENLTYLALTLFFKRNNMLAFYTEDLQKEIIPILNISKETFLSIFAILTQHNLIKEIISVLSSGNPHIIHNKLVEPFRKHDQKMYTALKNSMNALKQSTGHVIELS